MFCLPEQWATANDFNCLVPGIYFNILRRAQWVTETDAQSALLYVTQPFCGLNVVLQLNNRMNIDPKWNLETSKTTSQIHGPDRVTSTAT